MNRAIKILSERGFINQCTNFDALSDLMDKGPVTFYCGTDPTGPSLHIGHIVPFFAMHHLQACGNNPIALVGDGTGLIGDPSGKTEMRKILPKETIKANGERISKQLGMIVDFSDVPPEGYGKGTIEHNGDWLIGLNYIDFLRDVGSYFSVNRMLTFEGVKQRLERGLSFIEFNYQLLQAYDFQMLYKTRGNRLQIGGADQWGNIVAGIDLIQRMGGPECFGLTFNLITRADGKKMGKSEAGAIFLDKTLTPVYDFYQYYRNLPDADVEKCMKIFTFMSLDEIAEYSDPKRNINEAKEKLAYEVTKIIHGEEEADKARSAAKALFSTGGSKEGMPTIEIERSELEKGIGYLTLFVRAGLSSSNSEARTLISQGGAQLNGTKLTDVRGIADISSVSDEGDILLKAGKKKFARILVKCKRKLNKP